MQLILVSRQKDVTSCYYFDICFTFMFTVVNMFIYIVAFTRMYKLMNFMGDG